MAKYKVLTTIPKTQFERDCQRAIQLLRDNDVELVCYQGEGVMTAEEIIAEASDVSGVIVGCSEFPEEVLVKMPNLKVMARFGIGCDNIDLEAAKRLGIKVCNARGLNSDSVAEITVLMALALLRNLLVLDRTTREGGWMRYSGSIIHRRTWGLVGFGAISQNVVKILKGFEPGRILAYDPYPNQKIADEMGVELVDLDTLLKESDIISLHVPGTPQTANMFNAEAFAKMKNTAILINVARGIVVNEPDLYTALTTGQIAGAGLDVYAEEPTSKDNPLFKLDNVVLTPHQAADTAETFDAVGYFDAEVIMDVMNGNENPINWLNR